MTSSYSNSKMNVNESDITRLLKSNRISIIDTKRSLNQQSSSFFFKSVDGDIHISQKSLLRRRMLNSPIIFGQVCHHILQKISRLSIFILSQQKKTMMINRMHFKSNSMNMVHRSKYGTELWLGDYYAATNVSLLKQKNIKSVFTTAAMLGVQYSKQHEINHKTINAFDLPSYKMTPHFEEAYKFIDEALQKGNLLVHCAAGISRSTTCVLVYLMRGEGMAFKQGLDYVRSKRSIVCPNEGFQRELKRYELTLKKMNPQLQKQRVQANMIQSDNLQDKQKQAVIEFLKDQKQETVKNNSKMTSTVNGYRRTQYPSSTNNKQFRGIQRGQSLNYGKKTNPNILMESNNQKGKVSYENNKPNQMKTSQLANQFLTFKLENPKIVTIKK